MSSEQFKVPSEPHPILSTDSEDESFVVLGKSLTSDFDTSPTDFNGEPIENNIVQNAKSLINAELNRLNSCKGEGSSQGKDSTDSNTTDNKDIAQMEQTVLPAMPEIASSFQQNDTKMVVSISSLSTELGPEDLQDKIKQIVEENIRLKDTIIQNNMSMKSQYQRIVDWKEDVEKVYESHKQKFQEAKEYIEKLKKESLGKQEEVNKLMEQLGMQKDQSSLWNTTKQNIDNQNIVDKLKNENEEQKQEITCLKNQITTYEQQVQSLEQKLLERSQNKDEVAELQDANKKIKDLEDSIVKLCLEKSRGSTIISSSETEEKLKEAEETIKSLREELKKITKDIEQDKAEIYRLQLVQQERQQYCQQLKAENEKFVSENQQLKEYVSKLPNPDTANEELVSLRQQLMLAQAQLTECQRNLKEALGRANLAKSEMEEMRTRMEAEFKNETFVLRTQLELYKSDFEAELAVKEAIKEEKDKLAEDLQNIQQRNQQLQEEFEVYDEQTGSFVTHPPRPSAPSSSAASGGSMRCPKCSFGFPTYNELQDHVYRCLDLDGILP